MTEYPAEDLQKVKVLCSMNETHQRFEPIEMQYRGGILADRDLLFICPDCGNRVRIVFKSQSSEQVKEAEIVYCSCGETFDWENWDRKTWPMPQGLHDSIRHLDMGHTLMNAEQMQEVKSNDP